MRQLFLGLLLGLTASIAIAQTAEQLQMLQSLPADQRAAVLEQLTGQEGNATPIINDSNPQLVLDRTLTLPPEMVEQPDNRIRPGSTVVVSIDIDDELAGRERSALMESLTPRVTELLGASTYEIGADGLLNIDDYFVVPLAGLTVEQAAIRLAAVPDFRDLDIEVTLLPLTAVGADALTRFGYELFRTGASGFVPATNIPVPADYVIGPGDGITLQLFGAENARYNLVVNRDGVVQLPEIGPVAVAGMKFEQLRDELQQRIEAQMIGVEVSITLGELRSIRVFVLGDVSTPGSYTVSGLSTITHALYLSGGITESGSLRRIQLKRNGRTIRTLDLYRLLLQGDTRNDLRLQPGDAVFVPPVGATVGVSGEVVRPAIYELRGEDTVDEVIELAGGLLPSADTDEVVLHRMSAAAGRVVVDLDLSTARGRNTAIADGDMIVIEQLLERLDDAVVLAGHVYRPGPRQLRPGMRLSDLVADADGLRPGADLGYVLVARERGDERLLQLLSADLAAAWRGDRAFDPVLQPRDEIFVFSIDSSRAERILPLLERLRLQSRSGAPSPEVRVGGRIVAAGDYPLEPGMRVSDLLRAGGGLQEAAYTLAAELARYDTIDGVSRQTALLDVDLAAILAGNSSADLLLQPHDHLIIKEIPQWEVQESVVLEGEVRFPGTYLLQRGETLASVLARAGGLTDLAFADGSVFVREDLKRREQEQIENLASRLEADIVAFSLQSLQTDANAAQALNIGQSLLQQLRDTTATGRLVIEVSEVLANPGDPVNDIVMRDGDYLFIPKQTQEVTVLGEVQYATSHIYQPGLARNDYIARSGGLTQKADRRRIYIVRANGAVLSGEGSRWFNRPDSVSIRPGDTIVVPLDADRMSALSKWTNVSQIIYQLALAAASANAVGVF
ncbi:MAG: SLBB domain-containing protein [Gammaproteobacteria bacterium]|nr:SLBB domain-containing protein [Gammaproteobacteria bacterium]